MSTGWTRRSAAATVTFLLAALITAGTAHPGVAAAAPPDPGKYQALTPARILDTRVGNGAPTAPLAPAATLAVTALGRGGIPADGVSAVAFNLTDVGPSTYGFISAYPAGQTLPLASSLNFSAGETRAHLVVVAPGTEGQVALYNGSAGAVDLLADVVGYYTAGTPTAGGEFAPLTPARVLDTRTGNGATQAPLDRLDPVKFQVLGRGGVPATGVSSVMVNLTATRPSTYGYLTASAQEYSRSSSVNFHGGSSVSNLIIVPVYTNGTITVTASLQGHVDAVADVLGYYADGPPSAAGRFGGLPPTRLLDTRLTHAPIPAQGSIDVPIAGHDLVPTGSGAVVLNVTAASATTSGYLAVYSPDVARPTSSTVNFDHNTVANLTMSALSADGRVRIYNGSGAPVDVVVDVSGFIAAIPGGLTWSGWKSIPGADGNTIMVSCASASFCVGDDTTNGYRWDGHSWSGPTRIGQGVDDLSCPVDGFCVAEVGQAIDFYDGTTWRSSQWAGAGTGTPNGVSCVSASFCLALSPTTPSEAMVSWVYNGHTWTKSASLSGSAESRLSCTASNFCMAVNNYGTAYRFDGTTWTPAGSLSRTISYPESLSCVTATFCVELGLDDASIYNGTSWSSPTKLDVGDQGDWTHKVSCASTTLCFALATDGDQLVYDGTSWSTRLQLDPANASSENHDVTCFKPRDCLIVNGYQSTLGT